jgi:FkbM family methyltransferase
MNKQELKNIIGEANVILDIGSYDGKDARELHELFGCQVHCFEPNEEVFKWSEGLIYWPFAVSNSSKNVNLIESDHPQSSSLKLPHKHKAVWPKITFYPTKAVTCIRLDRWSENKRNIDLIWCDVNGSEGDLIAGATETLKHTRYLYIEVSDKELYAGQPKINEVIAMLPDFKVIGLYDFGENFGNILFKNTKL